MEQYKQTITEKELKAQLVSKFVQALKSDVKNKDLVVKQLANQVIDDLLVLRSERPDLDILGMLREMDYLIREEKQEDVIYLINQLISIFNYIVSTYSDAIAHPNKNATTIENAEVEENIPEKSNDDKLNTIYIEIEKLVKKYKEMGSIPTDDFEQLIDKDTFENRPLALKTLYNILKKGGVSITDYQTEVLQSKFSRRAA